MGVTLSRLSVKKFLGTLQSAYMLTRYLLKTSLRLPTALLLECPENAGALYSPLCVITTTFLKARSGWLSLSPQGMEANQKGSFQSQLGLAGTPNYAITTPSPCMPPTAKHSSVKCCHLGTVAIKFITNLVSSSLS